MIITADAKKRVVLPGAAAGDVFAVAKTTQGLLLKRIHRRESTRKKTRAQVRNAIRNWKALRGVKWEELRAITREI
jgi:hypothetical protein